MLRKGEQLALAGIGQLSRRRFLSQLRLRSSRSARSIWSRATIGEVATKHTESTARPPQRWRRQATVRGGRLPQRHRTLRRRPHSSGRPRFALCRAARFQTRRTTTQVMIVRDRRRNKEALALQSRRVPSWTTPHAKSPRRAAARQARSRPVAALDCDARFVGRPCGAHLQRIFRVLTETWRAHSRVRADLIFKVTLRGPAHRGAAMAGKSLAPRVVGPGAPGPRRCSARGAGQKSKSTWKPKHLCARHLWAEWPLADLAARRSTRANQHPPFRQGGAA